MKLLLARIVRKRLKIEAAIAKTCQGESPTKKAGGRGGRGGRGSRGSRGGRGGRGDRGGRGGRGREN